jgi:hypothetical protein
LQRLRCSGRGFRIRLTLKGTIALQAKPIKSPIRPAQRGSPQNGPSAGRSAEAVWVLWETTGGLRLPLQPTTSDSGALLTFAHYNLPFRVSNKTAPVRRWSRSGAAGTAQGRLATFGCSRTHPSLRRCSILNTVLISQSGCRQYRVRGAGPF